MRGSAALRVSVAPGGVLAGPWVRDELWRRARMVPSLDLRFADYKSLVDAVSGQNLVTFTRAYSGTFIGSDGLLQTAGVDVPRFDHDPITGESLGLLIEEQRIQLLELTQTLATQTKTVTAVPHTLSFYGTGTVVLSGVHSATVVGMGAYPARTTLTFTPTAGSLTLTVTGTVEYGQLEAGACATSYIPNAGVATVTRSADLVSITGEAFTSWFNSPRGAIYADCSLQESVAHPVNVSTPIATFWSTSQRGYGLVAASSSLLVFFASRDAVGSTGTTIGTYTPKTFFKAAGFYDYGSLTQGGSFNSDPVISGLLRSPPTPLEFYIGSNVLSGLDTINQKINGHIRRLTYWPTRLSNATLQAISQ